MTEISQLEDLVETALQIARHDLEATKQAIPVILLREPDGQLKQLVFPRNAALLMNSGPAKDAIFEYIRKRVKERGLTAVVFATEAWLGKPTALGLAQMEQLGKEGYRKKHWGKNVDMMADEGLCERVECLIATAQTAETVLMVHQTFCRDGEGNVTAFDEPEIEEFPQSDFAGRQKMYGDLREENLR